jgi:hypothetical protein
LVCLVQVVTYGHRETPESICNKIDNVKAEDIMRSVPCPKPALRVLLS